MSVLHHLRVDCGGCGTVCPASSTCMASACVCSSGLTACFSRGQMSCVNLTTDNSNCGACNNVCPTGATCQTTSGVTACVCPTGQTNCGTSCADLSSSTQHCGSC